MGGEDAGKGEVYIGEVYRWSEMKKGREEKRRERRRMGGGKRTGRGKKEGSWKWTKGENIRVKQNIRGQ